MSEIKITVFGKVTGVSFRFFVETLSTKMGLVGYAQNLPDGSLEIVAQGPRKKLLELAALCKTGPRYAVVEKIELAWQKPSEIFQNFEIRLPS